MCSAQADALDEGGCLRLVRDHLSDRDFGWIRNELLELLFLRPLGGDAVEEGTSERQRLPRWVYALTHHSRDAVWPRTRWFHAGTASLKGAKRTRRRSCVLPSSCGGEQRWKRHESMVRSTRVGRAYARTTRVHDRRLRFSAPGRQQKHSTGRASRPATFLGGDGTTRKRCPRTRPTGKDANGERRRRGSASSPRSAVRLQVSKSGKRQAPDALWPQWQQRDSEKDEPLCHADDT